MKIKKIWKNLSYWKKGGIIGFITTTLIFFSVLIYDIINQNFTCIEIGKCPFSYYLRDMFLIGYPLWLIVLVFLGIIIGFIFDKLK